MVLRVPFGEFVSAVERWVGKSAIYVESRNAQVRVTAANPLHGLLLETETTGPLESVKRSLEDAGLVVGSGCWREGDDAQDSPSESTEATVKVFVAAVAYQSDEGKPGLWLDAYPYPPTETQVLNAMHDEMTTNGEIADVPFETFVRLSMAHVVVVSPDELEHYLRKRQPEVDG